MANKREVRYRVARFLISSGEGSGQKVEVIKSSFFIGRGKANDLVISDGSISRVHAQIKVTREEVYIHDLNSRNGTYVNEERITDQELKPGDNIRLGKTYLTFLGLKEKEVVTQRAKSDPMELIDRKIDSLLQLNILVLLYRRPSQFHEVKGIARELNRSQRLVLRELKLLTERGLAHRLTTTRDPIFRAIGDGKLRRMIDKLIGWFSSPEGRTKIYERLMKKKKG